MRRVEKRITEKAEFDEILNAAEVIYVAMADGDEPYVLPMNFGYSGGVIYIHCAPEGKKIDMIRKNPKVCFNVTVDTSLFKGVNACAWTYHFRSVIGRGQAEIVTDRQEIIRGLDVIMEHYGRENNTYNPNALDRVVLVRIKIDELTGKRSPAVKRDEDVEG